MKKIKDILEDLNYEIEVSYYRKLMYMQLMKPKKDNLKQLKLK